MITSSDTMVTMFTWETGALHCGSRVVPLPHAMKMLTAGFHRVKLVAENGEVIADTLQY